MIARTMFSRRWIMTTFVALLAVAVLVRLGIWQMDRLDQRRADNLRIKEQIDQSTLELIGENLRLDLNAMEYRKVIVRGHYDFSQEVALRNQVWNDQIGVHLLTPMKIVGSDQAVIIDRGWIPQDEYLTGDWSNFHEPGELEVAGLLRLSRSRADFGRINDGSNTLGYPLRSWNLADIEQIAVKIPYPILPVYIQLLPDDASDSLPYRSAQLPTLTEGSHQSYAIQWFMFAAILAIGYPIYVKNEKNKQIV